MEKKFERSWLSVVNVSNLSSPIKNIHLGWLIICVPIRNLTLVAPILSIMVFLTGCEDPVGNAAMSSLLGANASIAQNAHEAATLGALAQTTGAMSSMQHQKQVAEAGRSQIIINDNTSQSATKTTVTYYPQYKADIRLDDGGIYTGFLIDKGGELSPHGRGVVTYPDGSKRDGEFNDGMLNGRCVVTHADGSKYEGEFKDNKYNGHGVYIYHDLEKYDGEWKDDKRSGRGVQTYQDGSKYDGEFKDDKPNGYGVRTWPDGTKFDGVWKDGIVNGNIIRINPDGRKISGEFVNGLANGSFRSTNPHGTDIVEEWENGISLRLHGIEVWPDGTKYDGEWNRDGKGKGAINWTDGRNYKGDWKVLENKQDLPDGEGTMSWADGRKYIGDFRDGKMHGIGKMTYSDGKIEEGAWQNNMFVGGQPHPYR